MQASNHDIATKRASMPAGANKVLDRRTLDRDNKNLLPFLKPGMSVMDVGCGSGAITKGIAAKVGATGSALGIDTSEALIAQAKQTFANVSNLSFQQADILDFETQKRFDLITSARTLQWMTQTKEALMKMKELLKVDGRISVLDYNHEKIEWNPAPPESMLHFYDSFLQWRSEAGMNNKIADDLKELFSEVGLKDIIVSEEMEMVKNSDPDFHETAGIWTKVAETRGNQLVTDGYITEAERLTTIDEYEDWLKHTGISMKMYLLGVSGQN